MADPDTTIYYESLLSRDGIKVDYNDDTQVVSFKESTFNINRGLNVTRKFLTNFSTQLTVISTGRIKGTLRVDGAFNVKSTLLINNTQGGITRGESTLTVNGSSKLNGPTHIYNTLSVAKKADFISTLDVSSIANMKSTLIVGSIANLNNGAVLTNAVGNALTVDGKSKLHGAAHFSSIMDVTGAAHMKSSLTVEKISRLNDAVTMTKLEGGHALTVHGTTKLSSFVSMKSSLSVGGPAHMLNSFTVYNSSNLNSTVSITNNSLSGYALTVASNSKLIGDVKLNSALSTFGAVSTGSTLSVLKKAMFHNALDVMKPVHLKSSLIVNSTFNPKGGMTVANSASDSGFTIAGNTTISDHVNYKSSLTVGGSTILSSSLRVSSITNLNSSVVITYAGPGYALNVNGSTKLKGVADLTSSLSVGASVKLWSTFGVKEYATLKSTLDVVGSTLMKSNLQVNSTTILKKEVIVNRSAAGNALKVTGSSIFNSAAVLGSSLQVLEAVHLKSSLKVSGATTLNDILTITNANGLALIVDGSSKLSNAAVFNSSTTVTGIANMMSSMIVAGASKLNDGANMVRESGNALSVIGSTLFGGNVVIHSSLTVKKHTQLSDILTLTGKAAFKDAMDVTGAVKMKSTFKVGGSTILNEKVMMDNKSQVGGSTLIVSGKSQFNNKVTMSEVKVFNSSIMNNVVNITNTVSDYALTVAGKTLITKNVNIGGIFNGAAQGNFTINGSSTMISSTLQIKDNAILIGSKNTGDTASSGVMMQYMKENETTHKYAGLRRKPNTGEFSFFKDSVNQIPTIGSGESEPTSYGQHAKVKAASFTCFSDERLKKNIVPLDGALDKIDGMKGVYHDWNDENQPERAIGVIAQDVKQIYPELVNTGGDGFLAVNYPKLTAVLLQSVKELKSMVQGVILRRKSKAPE